MKYDTVQYEYIIPSYDNTAGPGGDDPELTESTPAV